MSDFADHLERGLIDEFEWLIPSTSEPSEPATDPDYAGWEYPMQDGAVIAEYERMVGKADLQLARMTFTRTDNSFSASWQVSLLGVSGELECDELGRLAAYLIRKKRADRDWLIKCLEADEKAGVFDAIDALKLHLEIHG